MSLVGIFRGCTLAWIVTMFSAEWTLADDAPALPTRGEFLRALADSQADGSPVEAPRPLAIVLLADDKDHGPGEHDYPRWRSRWALLLGGAAASPEPAANLDGPDRADADVANGAAGVSITTAQGWPSPDQWAQADVVVAFCYLAWNESRLAEVRAFLQRGGGLVVIHSATWTKPGPSAAVAELTGVGGFVKWRHGPVELEVSQPDHAICRGLPPVIRLEDESYWPPTPPVDPARVETLAVSREVADEETGAGAAQPMFWTYSCHAGRVFGCVLGHSSSTFDHPYFRLLLLRGIAWSAREHASRFDPLASRSAAFAD